MHGATTHCGYNPPFPLQNGLAMRLSKFHIATTREDPADAEIASHRLMLRAGMIRKLASGIYTWSPLGLRVLRKVEAIIREEMRNAGAIEMLMPSVQPRELWDESGRWNKYGPALLKFRDRREQEFCYGPTHEEVICEFARNELRSYRQLPVTFFQIQTKFRDEIRPRFGVMRSREFIMKDAYSFHMDQASQDETYRAMYDAYSRIFTRLGLEFRAVAADSGAIGGDVSHEFQVMADSGEDAIAFSDRSDYAANVELAEAVAPATPRPAPSQKLTRVETPEQRTIEEVGAFLNVPARQCVKTLLVRGTDGRIGAGWRGRSQGRNRRHARFHRAGGTAARHPRDRGPFRRGAGGFRLRRQCRRDALHRRQLGTRCAHHPRGRPAQGGRGRSLARRPRHALDRTRHRGRPHLPERRQVHPRHERRGAGRGRQGAHADHRLLRHRRHPDRGRGDRTESRRARHHLARRDGAVARGDLRHQSEKRSGGRCSRGIVVPGHDRTRHRNGTRRPRIAARRDVRRPGIDRHSAPDRGQRTRPRRGQVRISRTPRRRKPQYGPGCAARIIGITGTSGISVRCPSWRFFAKRNGLVQNWRTDNCPIIHRHIPSAFR